MGFLTTYNFPELCIEVKTIFKSLLNSLHQIFFHFSTILITD